MISKLMRLLTRHTQEDYLNAKARHINKTYDKYRQKDSCEKGYHVPVRMVIKGEPDDYCCQNCVTPMTEKDWRDFFEGTEIGEYLEEVKEYYR